MFYKISFLFFGGHFCFSSESSRPRNWAQKYKIREQNNYNGCFLFHYCFIDTGVLSFRIVIIFVNSQFKKVYIYIYHHHHHVVPPARIPLTLSRHFFLSFIASGRSSGLHPVSSQSCCMYVQAGHPAFARPYVGVHRSTSLISLSLLLQQCPACLVCLTWIVFVMGGRWPYSWCFVGVCLQDLVNITHSILV